jgi:hypothetical protein
MFNIDYDNLNPALDILKTNLKDVENTAWRSVTDFGLEHSEVIVICAIYNFFWEEFVDGLNPTAATEAINFRAQGLIPVSISAATQEDFADYLRATRVDIRIPPETPVSGKVWLLILHEKGHTWLQISAVAAKPLDS